MTDKERDEVVTILRCAADTDASGRGTPFGRELIADAHEELDGSERSLSFAYSAWVAAFKVVASRTGDDRRWYWTALEAAALIEDGWSPGDPLP